MLTPLGRGQRLFRPSPFAVVRCVGCSSGPRSLCLSLLVWSPACCTSVEPGTIKRVRGTRADHMQFLETGQDGDEGCEMTGDFLQKGDTIRRIDGESVDNLTVPQAMARLRGSQNSCVKILVIRKVYSPHTSSPNLFHTPLPHTSSCNKILVIDLHSTHLQAKHAET